MSALSCCVTCGMTFQAWPRCSAVLRRMLLIGLRSTSPHLVKSGSGRRRGAPPPRRRHRPAPLCTNACTSSTLMRPSGPLPGDLADVDAELARQAAHRRRGRRGGPGGSAVGRRAAAAAAAAPRLMSTTSPRFGRGGPRHRLGIAAPPAVRRLRFAASALGLRRFLGSGAALRRVFSAVAVLRSPARPLPASASAGSAVGRLRRPLAPCAAFALAARCRLRRRRRRRASARPGRP